MLLLFGTVFGFYKAKQIFYVTDVVFYCADYINLLPVVHHQNDRRELNYNEQKSFEKVPVLDKRNINK
jgi:hypothetical protein